MNKRRLFTVAPIVVGLIVLGAGCNSKSNTNNNNSSTNTSNNAAVTTSSISMSNFTFSPGNVTVKVGTTVSWTNYDSSAHQPTGDNGGPASGSVAPGGTYSYTFNTVGTFPYHCAIHPSMTGTVTVTQ